MQHCNVLFTRAIRFAEGLVGWGFKACHGLTISIARKLWILFYAWLMHWQKNHLLILPKFNELRRFTISKVKASVCSLGEGTSASGKETKQKQWQIWTEKAPVLLFKLAISHCLNWVTVKCIFKGPIFSRTNKTKCVMKLFASTVNSLSGHPRDGHLVIAIVRARNSRDFWWKWSNFQFGYSCIVKCHK